MNSELQKFIGQIVESTKLKYKVKNELFCELHSHTLEEEKELQLQGFGEEKIFTTIQSRWGNIQSMSKELSQVHATNYTRYVEMGIVIFMLLSMLFMFFGGCQRQETFPQTFSTSNNK